MPENQRAPDFGTDTDQMITRFNMKEHLTGKAIRAPLGTTTQRKLYVRVSYRAVMRIFANHPDAFLWITFSRDLFHKDTATITAIDGMTASTRSALDHSTIG